MNTTMNTGNMNTTSDIDRLAWSIDQFGFGFADDAQIDSVVAHARTTGASPVLVDVLADETQPVNARTRAFGMVALQASRRAA